jgi:hypothetical protein
MWPRGGAAQGVVAMAEAAVVADAEYRTKLIVDAKRLVEQWRVECYFGKAAIRECLRRKNLC